MTICAATIYLCTGLTTLASGYSLDGAIEYDLNLGARGSEHLSRKFDLSVQDSSWKLSIVQVGNKDFDRFLYVYDGTNMMYYAIPADTNRHPNLSGIVEATQVPRTWTSSCGEYVWLAFASGCYFPSITNGKAISFRPLTSALGESSRFELPCDYVLSPTPPFLPTKIAYRETKLRHLDKKGNIVAEPLPPPFQSGYLSASFSTSSYTNVAGLSFPLQFEYRAYRPSGAAKTATNLDDTVTVRGTVTHISVSQQQWTVRLPGKKFFVTDVRVPEQPATYPIIDGVLPPPDAEVVTSARIAAAQARLAAPTRDKPGPK